LYLVFLAFKLTNCIFNILIIGFRNSLMLYSIEYELGTIGNSQFEE
jgi:hypothetical protein